MAYNCKFLFFQPHLSRNRERYTVDTIVGVFRRIIATGQTPLFDFNHIRGADIRPEFGVEQGNFIHIEFLKMKETGLPYDVRAAGPAQPLGTNRIGIPTTVSLHVPTGIIAAQTHNAAPIGINSALRYMSQVTQTAKFGGLPILDRAMLAEIQARRFRKLEVSFAEPLSLANMNIDDDDDADFLEPMVAFQDRMNAAKLSITVTADQGDTLSQDNLMSTLRQIIPFAGARQINKIKLQDEDKEKMDFLGIQEHHTEQIELTNDQIRQNFAFKAATCERGFADRQEYFEELAIAG